MRRLRVVVAFLLLCSVAFADSPYVGSFSRMGFGARGMGMGNAMVAMRSGEMFSYYNPASPALADSRQAQATAGILSLDRSLNFLSYTQPIKPQGGFSIGLINAGVSKIDGRNNDGVHTEDYSTFENQFYLSFANRVAENLSIGATIKMYYSKLFEEVTASTVGFDIGAMYLATPELTFGVALQELSTKYTWSTSNVLGRDGKNPKEKFPMVRKLGASYAFTDLGLTASLEYENTSASTQAFKLGAEYAIHENITVRGGLDRWEFDDDNTAGAKPSFGFTARQALGDWTPALSYAFIFEPFSSHDIHVITLSTTF